MNLLSVPRANVKSNVVFGQDTGYSTYIINYNGPEIVDRIENAEPVAEPSNRLPYDASAEQVFL